MPHKREYRTIQGYQKEKTRIFCTGTITDKVRKKFMKLVAKVEHSIIFGGFSKISGFNFSFDARNLKFARTVPKAWFFAAVPTPYAGFFFVSVLEVL